MLDKNNQLKMIKNQKVKKEILINIIIDLAKNKKEKEENIKKIVPKKNYNQIPSN